jgi:hypothetical protein
VGGASSATRCPCVGAADHRRPLTSRPADSPSTRDKGDRYARPFIIHPGRSGCCRVAVLPGRLVAQRCRRWADPDRAAGATGNGVRGTGRAAADHRAVHIDPVLGRLRGVRPVQGVGAGPRFIVGADDRGVRDSAGRGQRRPRQGGGLRLDARPDGRGGDGARRCFQARVRRRPAVQTDADRVHERVGADHR